MARHEGKGSRNYEVSQVRSREAMKAPVVPYLPVLPRRYRPKIGLIGCGGITESHLKAYKKAGLEVTGFCDLDESRAHQRRKKFYPRAKVYGDHKELLSRDDIEVVDIATHPEVRADLIEAALKSGKHVLSQKPFVTDLDRGRRLVRLARRKRIRLAVNQNGRWAPHFSFMRNAVSRGLLGEVLAVHMSVHWDHNWIAKTPFDQVRHIALYDFGIHWFDMLHCLMRQKAVRVFASFTKSPVQKARPPLLAQAGIEYRTAQASLSFDADTRFGSQDRSCVVGTKGTLHSVGPDLQHQTVTLETRKGRVSPKLKGTWFTNGFLGSMAELLCAIEEKREPLNNAADNLNSLALCFAALESAESGKPIRPGSVKKLRK